MAWKLSEKNKTITKLLRMRQDGQKLEMMLRIKHPDQDADLVWQSNQRLGTEIDSLIGRAMDDWGVSAEATARDLGKATDGFKQAVKDIKADVKVAQKIVKAASYLDDAVKVARKLLDIVI